MFASVCVSDSDSISTEKIEVRRDTGGSTEEGNRRLRSTDCQTGSLLHSCGQQHHCQDAGTGKGNAVAFIKVFVHTR